jgi:cysteine desulfurase
MKTIYMDNSASSRMLPEVLDAMKPAMLEFYGNASSVHHKGREARKLLEDARGRFASLIGARPEEIIFTSGGTEADNLALRGVMLANKKKGSHIVTSAIEHHAVLFVCRSMEKDVCTVDYAPVDKDGIVDLEALKKLLRGDTVAVSVMHANNEVGTIQPIPQVAAIAHEKGAVCHTDAVQSVGKIPIDVRALGVDLMSVSAHKFHGPKGVGALFVKKGTRINGISFGGHHERNLRPGTENVAGILGMVKALEIAVVSMEKRMQKLKSLRDKLEKGIAGSVPEITFNGHREKRLPHMANIGFRYVEGEGIILSLDELGICVSSGSACTSDTLEPSHVLTAMCVPAEHAHGSIRFSLSEDINEADVDFTVKSVADVIEKLRKMSPLYNKKK